MCNFTLTHALDVPFLMNKIARAIALNLKGNPFILNMNGYKEYPQPESTGLPFDVVSLYVERYVTVLVILSTLRLCKTMK